MCSVLIAEDDVNLSTTCKNYLTKEYNFKVVGIAHTGKEAINAYIETKPDILVLDLKMPDMNGIEVIDQLSLFRGEKKKNNIIVLSGDLKNLIPYNTSKVFKIMSKPFSYEELAKAIYEIKGIIDSNLLEEKIDDLFLDLKLNFYSSKNLTYLKQAVIFCFNNLSLFDNFENVYTRIADSDFRGELKPRNVKWGLESLLNSYKKNVNNEFLQNYFTFYWDSTRTLTPKYIIEAIVIHLKKTI